MSEQEYRYTLHAVARNDQGKGASRRLRREGLVPAIVYGGNEAPATIAIKQDELIKNAKNESFFSQIINLKVEGQEDSEVLVRDVQHHLFKPLFQHFDFQRIVRGQEITATVSLHFINEEKAPGVKTDGGIVEHYETSLEIQCRPSKLPEFIIVDMGNVEMNEVVHLGNLELPEGVHLTGEYAEEDADLSEFPIAKIVHPQREEEEEEETPDTDAAAPAADAAKPSDDAE